MSKIWIATQQLLPGTQHLYLVYDPDGDPSSGDELVWNGYPSDFPIPTGNVSIENWVPIDQSKDTLGGDDPFTDRNYTEVDTGTKTPEEVKDDLSDFAEDLGATEGDLTETNIPYTIPITVHNGEPTPIPGINSNTTVKSGLNKAGVDLNANLPEVGGEGSGNGRFHPSNFPGAESHYTGGDGNYTIPESDNDQIIYNEGGNNTYDITPNPFGTGQIIIVEDDDANTTDRINIHDIDPDDIIFQRTPSGDLEIYFPWDVGGDPSIIIPDQWDEYGVPKMNTLWIYPPDGSAPVAIPLNTPENFPLDIPPIVELPQWLDDLVDDWFGAKSALTPLVLDLDGNGVELASVSGSGSVYWDIDEDGFSEVSGWISGNDGLLAIDLNSDGVINDHGELFGNDSADGFTMLSSYDSNSDGVINSSDSQFNDLLVWVDSNSDGYSQSTELFTLLDIGITSINLNASLVDYSIAGNHITHESSFVINGQSQTIVDAWFAYDNANSYYAGDYTLDIRTLYLPTLKGFGDLKNLETAMSMDETLRDLVQDIVITDSDTLFDPTFDLQEKISDILYRWAEVDGVDPNSRGGQVDARSLGFLEALLGDDFIGSGGSPDPINAPATIINNMFETVLQDFTLSLLVQTPHRAYLDNDVTYDHVSAELTNPNDLVLQDFSSSDATTENSIYLFGGSDTSLTISELNHTEYDNYDQLWVSGVASDVRTWIDSLGYLHVKLGENSTGEAVISAQSSAAGSDVHTRLEEIRFEDGTVWDLTDTIILTDLDTGNNLYGSSIKDVLTGRGGDDHLYGREGDDVYVWSVGDGNDIIDEGGGNDQLVLHGVVEEDIRLETFNNSNDLKIHVGNEAILITFQFFSLNTNNSYYDLYHVENLLLDDGTTIDLLNNLTFKGTDGADTINATKASDILVGGLGNDTLNGKDGDDQYVWSVGDGSDYINETSGIDQLVLHNVLEDDIRFEAVNGTDLKVHVGSEVISISYQLASVEYNYSGYDGYQVESLLLDDNTVIDLLNDLTFKGTDAAETVYGTKANDILVGGLGNDTLYGKEGDDQYVWSVGDGNDYISEAGGVDQLVLHGVIQDDIRLEVQYGTDLNIHIGGEKITIAYQLMSSYYNSSSHDVYQVESILLDDSTTIDLTSNLTFVGTSGSDNITGTKMADILKGLDGSDYLYGSDGDDVLYGGAGVDMLYGQAGADTFVFDDIASSDNIQDFDLSQGDKLDISDLLIDYDPLTDAITDFVQITESGGSSYLNVDVDGGADNFVQVAYIYNETGLTDEDALLSSGNLIAA